MFTCEFGSGVSLGSYTGSSWLFDWGHWTGWVSLYFMWSLQNWYFYLRPSCGHRSLSLLPPKAAVLGALPAQGGLHWVIGACVVLYKGHQEMIILKTSNNPTLELSFDCRHGDCVAVSHKLPFGFAPPPVILMYMCNFFFLVY